MSVDFESVVRRARAGDGSAFTRIVEELQDIAVCYAVSLVGDFSLAEEVAQEAFLKAFLDLRSLKEPKAFLTWFRQIVLTRSSRMTRRKRLSTVALEVATQLESGDPSADDLVNSNRLRAAVRDAIQTLPQSEAAAVTLYYISDYSYREIASFLDVPVSTVKSRLHSARGRLRDRLGSELQDDLRESRPSRNEFFRGKVAEALRRATLADPDGNVFALVEGPNRL